VIHLDQQIVQAVLSDWRTAPIGEGLRATLGFLEILTARPAELTRSDIDAMRAAGVSDDAIEEAIYICFLFSIMDRLADAFDFPILSEEENKFAARVLNLLAYIPL
jgi:alkylhydroperoxidase family enzyme